jgi:hypothetical protein
LTKLCGSCGEELLDSDRFCNRCGAAQPTRPPQRESYRQPTESVPKTELESLRASLVAKIGNLEAKLSESVPRQEVDTLHVKLRQLESLLAASIPRREAKAEADSLRARIALLQDNLAELVPKAELEDKVNELATANKAIEDLRGQLSQSSAKIDELQGKLSNSIPKTELETIKGELESRVVGLEAKLAASIPGSEARELRAETSVASRSPEALAQRAGSPKCPLCNFKNRPDAIYCASCGHKLEDEEATLKLIVESPIEQPSPATTTKIARLGALSKLKSLLRSVYKS